MGLIDFVCNFAERVCCVAKGEQQDSNSTTKSRKVQFHLVTYFSDSLRHVLTLLETAVEQASRYHYTFWQYGSRVCEKPDQEESKIQQTNKLRCPQRPFRRQ